MSGTPTRWTLLRLLALFLPSLPILYFATQAGLFPDNDYWDITTQMLASGGFSSPWRVWKSHINEHVVVIPRFLYLLNILVTGGTNTGLALIAWGAALCTTLVAGFWMLPDRTRLSESGTLIAILTVSVFVFTPRASHNWLLGMSGVAWIPANLFAIMAIAGLYQLAVRHQRRWLLLSLGAALLGALTYSTALVVWPALLFGAWYLRLATRYLLAYLLVGAAVYSYFLLHYTRPAHHPDVTSSLLDIGHYVLIFLGGSFTTEPALAAWYGGAGALAALLLMGYLFSQRRDEGMRTTTTPWLLLLIYAVGNGLLAALTRAGFGPDSALASRYTSLPALFWLSLFVMALLSLYLFYPKQKRILLGLLLSIITLSVVAMYQASLGYASMLIEKAKGKRLAAMSLVTGAYDMPLLKEAYNTVVNEVRLRPGYQDRFRRAGHLPFRAPYSTCARIGKQLPADIVEAPRQGAEVLGFLDQLEQISAGVIRVSGWAYSNSRNITCIAITNQDRIIRGAAITGFPRPDVAPALHISDQNTGWGGYARSGPEDRIFSAYAFEMQTGAWFPLSQQLPVPED